MSKNKKIIGKDGLRQKNPAPTSKAGLWAVVAISVLAIGGLVVFLASRDSGRAKQQSAQQSGAQQPAPSATTTGGASSVPATNPSTPPTTTTPPNDPNKEPQT